MKITKREMIKARILDFLSTKANAELIARSEVLKAIDLDINDKIARIAIKELENQGALSVTTDKSKRVFIKPNAKNIKANSRIPQKPKAKKQDVKDIFSNELSKAQSKNAFLTFEPNTIKGIIGKNASGKSTYLLDLAKHLLKTEQVKKVIFCDFDNGILALPKELKENENFKCYKLENKYKSDFALVNLEIMLSDINITANNTAIFIDSLNNVINSPTNEKEFKKVFDYLRQQMKNKNLSFYYSFSSLKSEYKGVNLQKFSDIILDLPKGINEPLKAVKAQSSTEVKSNDFELMNERLAVLETAIKNQAILSDRISVELKEHKKEAFFNYEKGFFENKKINERLNDLELEIQATQKQDFNSRFLIDFDKLTLSQKELKNEVEVLSFIAQYLLEKIADMDGVKIKKLHKELLNKCIKGAVNE